MRTDESGEFRAVSGVDSERRATTFKAALEAELIERFVTASPDDRLIFCSADAERGLSILVKVEQSRLDLEERCVRVQRRIGIEAPVRLFDEMGNLLPFAARVIDELRPRLQNGRALREQPGQRRYQALRTIIVALIMEGLKRGRLSIAKVYSFCTAKDLRRQLVATGIVSSCETVIDPEIVVPLERAFQRRGFSLLASDGTLSEDAVEILNEVQMQLLCARDSESRTLLEAFNDFEREEEEENGEEPEAARMAA